MSKRYTVADLMAPHVVCVGTRETTAKARELLRYYRVSALPVEDENGHPAGMVTTTDLAQAADGGLVSDVMTAGVFTVPKKAEVHVAARLMRRHHVHHLLVTEEKRVVGIVSSFDLLRALEDEG